MAQGGKGGKGANGGNGSGGGTFVGAAGSAALDQTDVLLNLALAGLAGRRNSGEGSGGGLYVTTGGVVTLHKSTVALNFASTSNRQHRWHRDLRMSAIAASGGRQPPVSDRRFRVSGRASAPCPAVKTGG